MNSSHPLLRFAVATLFTAGLNFGLTIALHEVFGVPEEAAAAAALVTVFITSFFLLRHFLFPGRGGSFGKQFTAYAASAAGFRASEYAAFLLLHAWLGMHYVVAMILIQTIAFFTKFVYYGNVVFAAKGTATAVPGGGDLSHPSALHRAALKEE